MSENIFRILTVTLLAGILLALILFRPPHPRYTRNNYGMVMDNETGQVWFSDGRIAHPSLRNAPEFAPKSAPQPVIQ